MAMTNRPESARSAARGDLTVRSWYRRGRSRRRRARPAPRCGTTRNCPERRGARLVPWSGEPRRSRRVRAGQQPAAGSAAAAVRRGRSTVVGVAPGEVVVASGAEAFAALDALTPGFWVGWCSFELGHAAERVVARGASIETRERARPGLRALRRAGGRRPAGRCPGARLRSGRALLDEAAAARASCLPVPSSSPIPSTRVAQRARPRRVRRPRRRRARAAARGRVLPGQPHASTHVRRRHRPGRAVPRRSRTRTPRRTSRCCNCPSSGTGTAVVSASPERYLRLRRRDVETRPIKGTAATAAALRDERQGPRRERDDRRPRPQRPRSGLRTGFGPGPGVVRDRVAPGAAPPREHRARSCARRRRRRRARATRRSRPRR